MRFTISSNASRERKNKMSAEEMELGRSAGWSPSLEDQDAALYAPCSSSPMPPTFGFEDCRVYEDAVSALDESSNLAGRIFAERELRQRRWDAERKGALAAYFRPAFQSGGFNNGLKLQAQDMAARNAAEHQRLSPRAAYGTPGAAGLREFDGREEHPERHLAGRFDACFATRSVDYDGATMRRQAAADQAPFQAGRPRELPRKLPKGKSAYLEEVVMSPIKVPRPGKRPEKAAGAALLRAKQARKQQETHLQHLRVTRGTLQQSTHRVQTPGSRHTSARPGSHIVGATMSTTAMGSAGSQIVNLMSIE